MLMQLIENIFSLSIQLWQFSSQTMTTEPKRQCWWCQFGWERTKR